VENILLSLNSLKPAKSCNRTIYEYSLLKQTILSS